METNQFRQKYMLVFIRLSNYNYFFLGRYIRPFLYPCPCSRPSIPIRMSIHAHPCHVHAHIHPFPSMPMSTHAGTDCVHTGVGRSQTQLLVRWWRAAAQSTVVPLPFCPVLAVCRRAYYYCLTFLECVFWNVRSYDMVLVECVQSLW